jgi:hypothetical protein
MLPEQCWRIITYDRDARRRSVSMPIIFDMAMRATATVKQRSWIFLIHLWEQQLQAVWMTVARIISAESIRFHGITQHATQAHVPL